MKREDYLDFLEILQQIDFTCLGAVELTNVARDIAVVSSQLDNMPENADLLAIFADYDSIIDHEIATREQMSDSLLEVIDTNTKLAMKAIINLPLKKQFELYERLIASAADHPEYLPLRDTVGDVISNRLKSNGNGIYS